MQALVVTTLFTGEKVKEAFELIHDVRVEENFFIFRDENEKQHTIQITAYQEVVLR